MDNHLIVVIQNQKKWGKETKNYAMPVESLKYKPTPGRGRSRVQGVNCERFVIQVDFKPEVIQRVVHTGCIAVRCRRAAHPL